MSNKELNAVLDTIEGIVKPQEGESIVDAVMRVTEELERFKSQGASAPAGGHSPQPAGATPAPANTDGDEPPRVDPDKGDLTPDYARWLVATQPLEACQQQYAGREQYLPEDVQAKLKGGQ